jgi:hypothetical protein
MIASVLRWPQPRLTVQTGLRMVAFGAIWGLMLSAGLTALSFYDCGVICEGDVIATTAMSVAAGIVTIGPLAAFRRTD